MSQNAGNFACYKINVCRDIGEYVSNNAPGCSNANPIFHTCAWSTFYCTLSDFCDFVLSFT